jgi:Na+/proline symporter
MVKSWMHDIKLALQARSGATPGLFVWLAIIAVASLTAFVFLCVASYDRLALELGNVFAGLVMAGIFVLIALIGAIVAAMSRRRARERAILERAARAHASSAWLLDPKILSVAMQAGRSLGWQRLVPIALLAFMAAQWVREHRERRPEDEA